MLLLKKKKYAAVKLQFKDGTPYEVIERKGLDMVRRDWSLLSKELGDFCLSQILSGGSCEDVVEAIHNSLMKVMDIKRLNNMMSDHGIYSRKRLLIPISNPDILVNGTCYIELDPNAKREVAALYLEGGPNGKSSHLLNGMTTKQGKRKVLDSLGKVCKLMMGLLNITCLFQMVILGLHFPNSLRT
ncbi:F-box protein At1g55000 [Fagus crenata]